MKAPTAGEAMSQGSETGENVMFWVDLSQAGLIDGRFTTASSHVLPGWAIWVTGTPTVMAQFLPPAKIGNGNYVYAFSDRVYQGSWQSTGINYFAVEGITALNPTGPTVTLSMTAQQAYNIDKKIDDGIPTTGAVQAWAPQRPATTMAGLPGSNTIRQKSATAAISVAPFHSECRARRGSRVSINQDF